MFLRLRLIYVLIAGLMLALGLMIFFVGQGPLRAYGGDVVVVLFLYSLMSLVTQAAPRVKVATIFSLALAIELLQLVPSQSTDRLHQLFLGSTFDVLDIVAYGLGLFVAGCLDSWARRQVQPSRSPHIL